MCMAETIKIPRNYASPENMSLQETSKHYFFIDTQLQNNKKK